VILKNYASRVKQNEGSDEESQIFNLVMLENSLNPHEMVHQARRQSVLYDILAAPIQIEGAPLKEESHNRGKYLTKTARQLISLDTQDKNNLEKIYR